MHGEKAVQSGGAGFLRSNHKKVGQFAAGFVGRPNGQVSFIVAGILERKT